MITSAQINKPLRKLVGSYLRRKEFDIVQARTAWRWHQNCVWVLKIRAVGNYFSVVTGWPSMSVTVETGIFYDFIPWKGKEIAIDGQGRIRPQEYHCHLRQNLNRTIQQSRFVSALNSRVERERKDIWWINSDGANLIPVIEDIVKSIEKQGIPWYQRFSNLREAYDELVKMRDSRHKFSMVIPFAQFLKLEEEMYLLKQKRAWLAKHD